MKKFRWALLISLLAVILTSLGCGAQTPNKSTTPAPKDNVQPQGDASSVTLHVKKQSSGNDYDGQ